jgi:SulP family sulfate permease
MVIHPAGPGPDLPDQWRHLSVQQDEIKEGTALMLSGVHAQPLINLEQSGLYYEIGEDFIFGNIDDALNGARRFLGLPEAPRPVPFIPTVAREREEG